MHHLLRRGLRHTKTSHAAIGVDGCFLAIDDIGAEWLGATPDEVVGRRPWELGAAIREAEWPAIWARIVERGRLNFDGATVGPDGGLVTLAVQFELVPESPESPPYALATTIRRPGMVSASEQEGSSRLGYASAFIDDPLIDWNLVTDELAFNAAAAALVGAEPGSEVSAERMKRALFPESLTDVWCSIREMTGGSRQRFEFVRQIEAPGRPARHLLLRLRVAARGPDGAARRLVVHGIDTTARRRALAEAREKQELFAAVAHTSTAGVLILDPGGQIVFANERAEQVLGLSRSALIERAYDDPAWRSTAPDGGPWPDEEQPFVRIMTTAAPVYGIEHAIEWPDGIRRQLSISGEPLFDEAGGIAQVLFTIDDITDRVAAAERLAGSERRLREVLDRLTVAVHLTDGEGRIQLWNRAAADWLMFRPGDVGQRRLHDEPWDMVDGTGAPIPPQRFPAARALIERLPVRGAEIGVLGPGDAERRWFRVDASPRLDRAGAVVDVVTQIADISEQRRLEQRLRNARRLEAVGRLAGGVAHDFNNLLTVVLSSADVLGAGLAFDDPLQVDVGAIRRSAARGASLVRALLGFAGRQFRQPRVVAIPVLVQGTWRRWSRRFGPGFKASIDLPDLPEMVLDPEQFEQVFEALLDNARDAMGRAGRLTIEVALAALEGEDTRWPGLPAGLYLRLVVADSGPGVEADAVPHIFEPFFSTRSRASSPGLGLANAHGILHQNGGGIRLAANGAEGATFEVVWPASPSAPAS